MHDLRCFLLVSAWSTLWGCNQGIDTISEGYAGGSPSVSTGGTQATSTGSGGNATSGTSGSSSGGGQGTAGDAVIGAGGDLTAGSSGASGTGGQAIPIEAGVDAKPDAPMMTGLAAYWKLDEAAGTMAADSSGRNHTATVVGGTWVTGKVGAHSLSFNGTSAYAEAPGAVVDTSKPYTVSAWVQLSTVNNVFHTAVSIDGASVSAFFLQLRGDNMRFGFSALATDSPQAATFASAQATPAAGTWYHLAGVFDGANLKLYVNGALQETKPYATGWAGTGATAIGRGFYSGGRVDFWPGLVDEVKLFGAALSDAEIMVLATP